MAQKLSDAEQSFENQAAEVMQRVRAAVEHLVTRVTGRTHTRSSDLVDALTVDPRLAWKFVKIIQPGDPLAAIRYVPGPRGIKLFLNAAARRPGVAPAIAAAKEAFGDFEALVRREGGDRRSFDMMVAGHSQTDRGDVDLEHRKGAFTHNSYIWGVQARAQIHTYLVQPSGDGEHLDAAVVRGFVRLRRVRPHTPWRISRFYTIDDSGEVHGEFARSPIDPPDEDAVPLLRRFCSKPMPQVRREVGPHAVIDYVLAESDVGNTGAVTCLTGELIRKAEPCFADDLHAVLGTKTPLRTPCEVVVADLFLRRDFFGQISPSLRLVSDLFSERMGIIYGPTDQLPLQDQVESLGGGPYVAPMPEMPRYAEMIQHCGDRLGWNLEQFDCYRVRVQYPPVPAALVVHSPLPPRSREADATG
ncbi:MAG: hypothetical protein PVJ57_02800 [Phycisphaerae bacterium]|jgi:hypothetical protein